MLPNVMGLIATGPKLLQDLWPGYVQFHGSGASILPAPFDFESHSSAVPTASCVPISLWMSVMNSGSFAGGAKKKQSLSVCRSSFVVALQICGKVLRV